MVLTFFYSTSCGVRFKECSVQKARECDGLADTAKELHTIKEKP